MQTNRNDTATAPTNAATAYNDIRRRILCAEYGAANVVSVQELSQQLGMSRTPIRDALIRLEKEGLVELVPRQGFRVLPLAPNDMLEIYQILAGLEVAAICILIERGLTNAEEARIRKIVEQMEKALSNGNLSRWSEADSKFHRLLIELAGNSRLRGIVEQFWDQTARVRALTLHIRAKPTKSTDNHGRLVDAIISRDVTRAVRIHTQQRLRSARELVEILGHLNIRQL